MSIRLVAGSVHREDDYVLSPRRMEALWEMEDRHFWHRARNAWIVHALSFYGVEPPSRVLEVGCGSGVVARALLAAGYRVTGVDTAEVLVRKAVERCPAGSFVVGEVSRLPAEDQGPYRAVGVFDVLEHLDRPDALLRDCVRWLEPGGLVVATVPALRALFGIVDQVSGHKRRYEPGEVATLFREVGIEPLAEHGIFRLTLPFLRGFRRRFSEEERRELSPAERDDVLRKYFRVPPAWLNGPLRGLCDLERRLAFRASAGRPGPTLLALGRVGA